MFNNWKIKNQKQHFSCSHIAGTSGFSCLLIFHFHSQLNYKKIDLHFFKVGDEVWLISSLNIVKITSLS